MLTKVFFFKERMLDHKSVFTGQALVVDRTACLMTLSGHQLHFIKISNTLKE